MNIKGYKGHTIEIRESVSPRPIYVGQRGALSTGDREKLQRSYGSLGCGHATTGEGGSLSFDKKINRNLNTCLWWLAAKSRKQIVLNISVGSIGHHLHR